ncbi:hypothetical protein EC991_003902 [Linnemannia zychae]|nr:hypothetical protein EC991_003902 [Linnemannia zychae]
MLVICGTGLNIDTIFCIQGAGSDVKDSSATFKTDKLPAPSDLPKDPNSVQQVLINIGDINLGNTFPREYVKFFIDSRMLESALLTMTATIWTAVSSLLDDQ